MLGTTTLHATASHSATHHLAPCSLGTGTLFSRIAVIHHLALCAPLIPDTDSALAQPAVCPPGAVPTNALPQRAGWSASDGRWARGRLRFFRFLPGVCPSIVTRIPGHLPLYRLTRPDRMRDACPRIAHPQTAGAAGCLSPQTPKTPKDSRWVVRWVLALAWGVFLTFLALPHPATAADLVPPEVAREYDARIRPLLQKYCLDCHSTEKHKGDLDLERFRSAKEAALHTKVWAGVVEQLTNREMPPKDHLQPPDPERDDLINWVGTLLNAIATARAGDPGPVVLRRLSNAEYTYTVRALTGIDSLEPAREFPIDGAAGEGFMNVGNGLVMSPSLLTKYLDAAKGIAAHAVLLPDGLRFSPATTRRDWTDEIVSRIKRVYARDADAGGKLPLNRYLEALLTHRTSLSQGDRTLAQVARDSHLNPHYLGTLWQIFEAEPPSPLLAPLVARWKSAHPTDAATLGAELERWQKSLTRFGNVGHMKPWVTAVDPVTTSQEIRFKIPVPTNATEVTLHLAGHRVTVGNSGDVVVWKQPRLVKAGRPDLWLRDLRPVTEDLMARRDYLRQTATHYLAAAAALALSNPPPPPSTTPPGAKPHSPADLDSELLTAWLDLLGIGTADALKLDGYLTNSLPSMANFAFVQGWGSPETPNLVANSSDQPVRIPGNLKAHGVAVHPSPTLQAAVGWRSPMSGAVSIESRITHAHPECGNGVVWSLELRRGVTRQRLATGTSAGSKEVKAGPFENVRIQTGDLVSLLVGPRDGNHSCDLTAVDLVIRASTPAGTGEGTGPVWDLAADISPDVRAANPHADRLGNAGVWHFYTEPTSGSGQGDFVIPSGSLLARWQATGTLEERAGLAAEIQRLLQTEPAATTDPADLQLRAQLLSLSGPLLGGARAAHFKAHTGPVPYAADLAKLAKDSWGLAPSRFDHHPAGRALESGSLALEPPSSIAVKLPADLAREAEFVATVTVEAAKESEALSAIQLEVNANGTAPKPRDFMAAGDPVLVPASGSGLARITAMFEAFRRAFPSALCYPQVVPVDEVITLTLFHREDEPLMRLMLDDTERASLDRLWDELRYVSRDALTIPDAYAQLLEYASQDSDPRLFAHLRQPISERAEALRRRLVETEPRHLEALLDFASRAYRRPLRTEENEELRRLYQGLRKQDLDHDAAFRLTLARILVAPAFLYRLESAVEGTAPGPVSDWELATRLSYFLWSSPPDDRLRELAAIGRLQDPEVLVRETRRMLEDERVRRLAIEFACQWLHIRDFDNLDEKSERHFPTFTGLRADMYEESIRFFTELFRKDGSVRGILDADHTFLNEALAKHYEIPGITGAEWRRVDGLRALGRGGVLGQATTLAKQSGASRTSPILRGNWISEVLLGDKLPRPPKDVPRLPEDEASTDGLTVRQLVEKHSSDPKCSGCHVRIDPFGFALEGFDAIGRLRTKDLAHRDIDTHAKAMDGARFEGIDGLRQYLLSQRGDAFLRQFCRKLLGYALGRGVQLTDEPLLTEMQTQLKSHDYRFGSAVEAVIRSRQFREIRGREMASDEE